MKTINLLPIEKRAFIKRIEFAINDKEIFHPYIAYVRKPIAHYQMKLDKNISQFDRCLKGYLEKEYPCDKLDECILEAVKNIYLSAESHTSLLLFNTELEDLQQLYQSYNTKAIPCEITLVRTMFNQQFQTFIPQGEPIVVNINVYCTLKKHYEVLRHSVFHLEKTYTQQEWDELRILNNGTILQYDQHILNQ